MNRNKKLTVISLAISSILLLLIILFFYAYIEKISVFFAQHGFKTKQVIISSNAKQNSVAEKLLNMDKIRQIIGDAKISNENIFSFDLQRLDASLTKNKMIKSLYIRRLLPDSLNIHIITKIPLAIWRNNETNYMITQDNSAIALPEYVQTLNLLKVTGKISFANLVKFLNTIKNFPFVLNRIKQINYLTSERWNIVLNNNILILLPQQNPKKALVYLQNIQKKHNIFAKDIISIDLRIPGNLIVKIK